MKREAGATLDIERPLPWSNWQHHINGCRLGLHADATGHIPRQIPWVELAHGDASAVSAPGVEPIGLHLERHLIRDKPEVCPPNPGAGCLLTSPSRGSGRGCGCWQPGTRSCRRGGALSCAARGLWRGQPGGKCGSAGDASHGLALDRFAESGCCGSRPSRCGGGRDGSSGTDQ